MSGYHDHAVLTRDRLAQLRELAAGRGPVIQKRRLQWYVEQGYLVLGAPLPPDAKRGARFRTVELTDKAIAIVGPAVGPLKIQSVSAFATTIGQP